MPVMPAPMTIASNCDRTPSLMTLPRFFPRRGPCAAGAMTDICAGLQSAVKLLEPSFHRMKLLRRIDFKYTARCDDARGRAAKSACAGVVNECSRSVVGAEARSAGAPRHQGSGPVTGACRPVGCADPGRFRRRGVEG